MRLYTVIILQLIIWSGYTLLEWLSKHDQPIYNVFMFIVFIYIGFTVGNYIVKSLKHTTLATFISLGLYGFVQLLLDILNF